MNNLKTKGDISKSGKKRNIFISFKKHFVSLLPLFKKNYTYISAEVTLQGDLIAKGRVVIDGKMHGNIRSSKHVSLGATSYFEGDIESSSALISGYVKGRIQAKTLSVKVPATIIGDLISTSVQIESGVILQGKILSSPQEDMLQHSILSSVQEWNPAATAERAAQ